MKKIYLAVYYLLDGDTSQVSGFFPDINKNDKNNIDLSSKLSLTYRVNVNHQQSKYPPSPVYSACVEIGNTLVAFKAK